jgi:hypothetical protein
LSKDACDNITSLGWMWLVSNEIKPLRLHNMGGSYGLGSWRHSVCARTPLELVLELFVVISLDHKV